MPIKPSAFLSIMAMALAALPARADWETTRWGMSPDEALSALANAKAHAPAASELYEEGDATYAPLVKTDYRLAGIATTVSLLFDTDDRLAFVLINPVSADDCKALHDHLVQEHGPGTSMSAGTITITDWTGGTDDIKLTAFENGELCNLSYRAR
ncbi:hypothetical protein [Phytopseudomonas dryadis]|uniref:Uncharacterized protein n=1 Tax=Phytopseudomonas dryadis TaxID=2487520 RepID=A0A4Q9R5F3_9GAMM|nr:hypothetical protein [Pseudomonas dryadis]TBU94667.1 hypothetical protein DNK44_08205 [Pseudomonas dryadis]